MAVAIGSTARLAGDGYTSRKTEAMPKSSLFGSILEIQDGDSKSIDVKKVAVPRTPNVKGTGQKFELPDDVKRGLPGAIVLEKSRRAVNNQKGVACTARDSLKQKEEEALYNLSRVDGANSAPEAPGTSRSQWFTGKDLEGAREINIVGLNKNQSYNRDKYGRRAPIHNYSYIGDVLKPGMDFPRRERTEIQMRNQGYGKGDLRGALAEGNMPPANGSTSARTARRTGAAVVDLPPNIKHQFGSRVCDNLLSDKATVEKTLRKQDDMRASVERKSKPFVVPKFTKELNPEYEMLGNALRMNVVPGYTMDHKISTTKTEFNDQVHLFKYQDPDKWRYQKDELSTWSEQQFIHNRLTKSWREMIENAPKFERNWTNDNSRTKTAPVRSTQPRKKPPPRSKPKTAPSKKGEENKQPAFEDFIFESPPVTPPPQTPEKINNSGQKKDTEFWNMYEKGVG